MKREFKFRAWNEAENKMYDWETFLSTNPNRSTFYLALEGGTLMQYTGLKDINNKEIYEGDIIRVNKCWDDGIDTKYSMIGKVIFLECCYFCEDIDGNLLGIYGYVEKIEVLGNIYQNQEILTS